MKNRKTYIRLIYACLAIIAIFFLICSIYLRKKSDDLLFKSAMQILEASSTELPQYFPKDTLAFFNQILLEVNQSDYSEEILTVFFNDKNNMSVNTSNFLHSVFRSMHKNRGDFALTSLNIEDLYNYTELKLEKYGESECYFSIVFKKEQNTGKLSTIKDLHRFLNYYAPDLLKEEF